MSAAAAALPGSAPAAPAASSAATAIAIRAACRRIAPLWPLRRFVAVNPFLGFAEQSFAATSATLRRVAEIEMLMPRQFYRGALESGEIGDADLEQALAAAPRSPGLPANVADLRVAAAADRRPAMRPPAVVATVAEVLDRLAAGNRQVSRTAFMVDEISKWCAAYYDEGQAAWRLPWRSLPPYAAWRATMRHDRNPEVMGVAGFRALVAALPEDPAEAIDFVISRLGIPTRAVEDYLHRALIDIGGWAAFVRYRVWESDLYGRVDDSLVELLAIRVVWGYALFVQRTDPAFTEAWRQAMKAAAAIPDDERLGEDKDLALDLILQQAYEFAYQRRLCGQLSGGNTTRAAASVATVRRPLQAAFCIDVRSEVYRRALESVSPQVQTLGFAGFFGFPVEYVPIGQTSGDAHCPVLLKPAFVVCEAVGGCTREDEETEILGLRLLRRRAANAWKAFKLSAVSCFAYVETVGPLYARKLLSDSLGLTRTVTHPKADGLDRSVLGRLGPRITPGVLAGRPTGFQPLERIAMAEAVLRGMSLTRDFARLVLLVGHGSSTVNNPHAAGLDCGACGGNTGEANARVAAGILNDPQVRDALRSRGIDIPADTWFLGGLHDTTTDGLTVFDAEDLPRSHFADLQRLRGWLEEAARIARSERAPRLGLPAESNAERRLLARSRDWSQVRPEWGLAGNAAFIAAPRSRTAGRDLGGRAFLHSYAWREDPEFRVLELIMTAPMVVASWINLQYYGATVNNRAFGSGNKALHNVVGTLGVLQGNAGDLQVGLPWQSVHDGQRFVHQPLRLSVFLEAPLDAINTIIARHEGVRQLVDNGWIHLFAMSDSGEPSHRYQKSLQWTRLS